MTELFRILRNLNLDTEELRPDFNMSNWFLVIHWISDSPVSFLINFRMSWWNFQTSVLSEKCSLRFHRLISLHGCPSLQQSSRIPI
jgi:hypothetical protein